jgi:chemotaxis protein histidine kinase CheA
MSSECEALEAARNEMRNQGPSVEALQKVSRAAHEIRGHAAVLGFPLAGRIAAILCRLLAYAPNPQLVPLAVIESHVDAIRAVVREQIHSINDKAGKEIFERLALIVESFLSQELGEAYANIAGDAPLAVQPAKRIGGK